MAHITNRPIPVLLGGDYQHSMGDATIEEEGDQVTITIIARGEDARLVAAVLTASEPMALSFVAIPVQQRKNTAPSNTNLKEII